MIGQKLELIIQCQHGVAVNGRSLIVDAGKRKLIIRKINKLLDAILKIQSLEMA